MKQLQAIATVAFIAALAASVAPALADGWRHRDWSAHQRTYAKKLYRGGGIRYYNNGGVRYYRNACTYGDCACLRNIAIATGNPVWWDKYQACTG